VGQIAISSTNTNVILCKCPWMITFFCSKIQSRRGLGLGSWLDACKRGQILMHT